MIINNRVKLLRKDLKLSQEKFGEALGIGKMSISQIENGISNLTDRNIKLICSAWVINEHWLRTGESEMYDKIDDELEYLVARYGDDLTDYQLRMVKALLKMSNEKRIIFDEFLEDVFMKENNDNKEKDD